MPAYELLRVQLLPAHGLLGVLSIALGIVALSVPKRPPVHPWVGRSFMLCMAVALVLSIPLILVRHNLFLGGVGLLVAYHMTAAWRLARLKPPSRRFGPLDHLLHPLSGLVFLVYAGYGVLLLARGNTMGLIPVVLSAISLAAVFHFWRFMRLEEHEEGQWIGEHIRGVAGAFIASLTAFTAAIGPRLVPEAPTLLLWFGPTLVFTPLFVHIGGKVQRELEREREEREREELDRAGTGAAGTPDATVQQPPSRRG